MAKLVAVRAYKITGAVEQLKQSHTGVVLAAVVRDFDGIHSKTIHPAFLAQPLDRACHQVGMSVGQQQNALAVVLRQESDAASIGGGVIAEKLLFDQRIQIRSCAEKSFLGQKSLPLGERFPRRL